jgi:DNA polymerase-1
LVWGLTEMRTLVFDIESFSASHLYAMPPEEFVRLIGFKWAGESEVTLTPDLEQVRDVIRSADMLIGHNIHAFDLPAIFGIDSDEPVVMADQGRVYDTFTHAALVFQAPHIFTDRNRRKRFAGSPAQAMAWYGLDELAFQLGVTRKTDDLRALAKEFGDPSLPAAARLDSGFGRIPVDDPRYRDYLIGDVLASEAVARALLVKGPLDKYAMREQRIAARAARISSNGFRVDTEAALAIVAQRTGRRSELLAQLAAYGLPTVGKKPWASNAGRVAVLTMLADAGVTPQSCPGWALTGKGQLSLGAEAVKAVTKGTVAEELGDILGELVGQRSTAQLAIDSTQADGFAHPNITLLQRSGRWSTTKPGLTVYSERDPVKRLDKAVFIPDRDTDALIELDYSAADARTVAALSGDREYAKLFEDGADVHAINAVLAFGAATVATDPAHYRDMAKRLGHAWNYGAGPRRLAATTGLPLAAAEQFCRRLAQAYPRLVRWQDRVRASGERGFVRNDWGRRMRVDRGRSYTQAPALLGQSGTREIICDALLRLPLPLLRCVKAQVHDAFVVSVPKADWEAYRDQFKDLMEADFDPPRGQRMDFPVSCGPPAADWADAGH